MHNKMEIPVEWGDTDPATIVFYPNYFKWFDVGTWRLLDAAGLPYRVIRDEFGLIGVPLVQATAKFMSPVRYADVIELTSFVSKWSRKTFQVTHRIRVNDLLCVEGTETRVLGRTKGDGTMEAATPPEEFRARLPVASDSEL